MARSLLDTLNPISPKCTPCTGCTVPALQGVLKSEPFLLFLESDQLGEKLQKCGFDMIHDERIDLNVHGTVAKNCNGEVT